MRSTSASGRSSSTSSRATDCPTRAWRTSRPSPARSTHGPSTAPGATSTATRWPTSTLGPTRASGATASRWPTRPRSCSARSTAADQVPFAIAFYAGLRRGEIHRLDWLDVEFIDGKPGAWLTVRPAPGKSGEGRRLPIAKPLRAILLRAYISQGRPSGGQVTGSAMSGKLIQRAMRAWGWTREAEGDEWLKGEDAMEPIGAARVPSHLRLVPDGRALHAQGDHGIHGARRSGDHRPLREGPAAAQGARHRSSGSMPTSTVTRPDPPGSARWP